MTRFFRRLVLNSQGAHLSSRDRSHAIYWKGEGIAKLDIRGDTLRNVLAAILLEG